MAIPTNPNSTYLRYNGVEFQNVQTISFQETPEFDESGIQWIRMKTYLKIVGYVQTKQVDGIQRVYTRPTLSEDPGVSGVPFGGASQNVKILRQYLMEPQRRLLYGHSGTANDDPIFIIHPASQSYSAYDPEAEYDDSRSPNENNPTAMYTQMDCNGGPYPKEVNITHLAGNNVWRVEFAIEFFTQARCNEYLTGEESSLALGQRLDPNETLNNQLALPLADTLTGTQRKMGILSNRWSCHDVIDENGYTTRTYTGVVKLANPNWSPHDFRSITIPPGQAGMERTVKDYQASEDNLTLRWTVVDKEVTMTAPQPSRTIKVSHTESLTDFGFKGEFNLRVAMTAHKNTKLLDLLVVANAIVEQRILFENKLVPNAAAKVMITRKDITTEQGSDAAYSLNLVVAGYRHNVDNGNAPNVVNLAKNVTRAVTWRVVKQANTALATYNNQLGFGNRPGEQQPSEESIPAITALHAKILGYCDDNFAVSSVAFAASGDPDPLYYSKRVTATEELKNTVTQYPDFITVEINDNTVDAETDLTYSTNHQTAMYNHYNITSEYGTQSLNVALPVANTTGSSGPRLCNVAVNIGPPQPTRTIRIVAERAGGFPQLPAPVQTFYEQADGRSNTAPSEANAILDVTNTLLHSKVTHLDPKPLADAASLLYTSYMDLTYLQNRMPKYHRAGIPDYINPDTATSGFDAISSITKYTMKLTDIFITGVLDSTSGWNYNKP